jgi:hypothetical protein
VDPSPQELQAEVHQLECEPLLVTVGKLQAQLRSLWVFKRDAEQTFVDIQNAQHRHDSTRVHPFTVQDVLIAQFQPRAIVFQ